jgi:hypothetical protein
MRIRSRHVGYPRPRRQTIEVIVTASAPTVMVSSTCYDLGQVRVDIAEFLSQMRYGALLSEFPSFPIDPDAGTIENCRRRVEYQADALVLVIGGRYGSVDAKSAKSITNLEYKSARAKRIPIFAFIDKRVLPLLPVWQRSPDADFAGVVDNPQLFEFIQEVRGAKGVWTFEFEKAQDIVETLRRQFAYLTSKAIGWTQRLSDDAEVDCLDRLRGEALRLALERGESWDIRLLGQLLLDSIVSLKDLERLVDLEISIGVSEAVADFRTWSLARANEIKQIAVGVENLLNKACQQALGAKGAAGDLAYIIFVGDVFKSAYRQSLEWLIAARRASVPTKYDRAHGMMDGWAKVLLESLREFAASARAKIEAGIEADKRDGHADVHLSWTIGDLGIGPFLEELDRVG